MSEENQVPPQAVFGIAPDALAQIVANNRVALGLPPQEPDAATPGQAVHHAFVTARFPGSNRADIAWLEFENYEREAWEAAAQAAVFAAVNAQPFGQPQPVSGDVEAAFASGMRVRTAPCDAHDREHFQVRTNGHWLCGHLLASMLIAQGIVADPEPQPAPELTQMHLTLPDTSPKASPELAAAMRETRQLRELVDDILGHFGNSSGDGWRARVGHVQIRKWRERAGLAG